MSRYSDINQLLEEMGSSDRSAGDPWTISRGSQGAVSGNSFSPGVVADLGAPAQDLTSEIQSSEQIAEADEVVTSPTGSSAKGSSKSSASSGILGGFLGLFPLASVVGKLFGLGGSSTPTPLTPYIQPPSVSFEGAMSSSLSASTAGSLLGSPSSSSSGSQAAYTSAFAPGVASLSYGANGLPRTVGTETAIAQPSSPVSQQDVVGQLGSLTGSNFAPEPAANSPVSTADLASTTSVQPSGSSSSSSSGNGASPANSSTSASSTQQGQSILVQVQAMDSQSFMDHSNDIAQAVRQAMLNSHSVNDVIADL